MTAFAVLDVALHIAAGLATFFWVRARLERFLTSLREETDAALTTVKSPVVHPDPRVDDLIRVVSTLKGAEALRQVYGKNQ